MSSDDFEKRLERQPMRQVPSEWRQDILSAARKASAPHHAPRTPHQSALLVLRSQLAALLWPHPAAWAGLAAVWVIILGLNLTSHDAASRVAKRSSPPSPQVFMAFQEQQRLLSELIGPRETPVAERPKTALPQPRSERQSGLLMA